MKQPAQRTQLQEDDLTDPVRLRRVLNDALLDIQTRLEVCESLPGLQSVTVTIETGASVSPTVAPFLDGGLRFSLPYTPTGVVLLALQQTVPSGQPVLTTTNDVKWSIESDKGTNYVRVDYVTGLAVNSRYTALLGVTRG